MKKRGTKLCGFDHSEETGYSCSGHHPRIAVESESIALAVSRSNSYSELALFSTSAALSQKRPNPGMTTSAAIASTRAENYVAQSRNLVSLDSVRQLLLGDLQAAANHRARLQRLAVMGCFASLCCRDERGHKFTLCQGGNGGRLAD
jgi:hypothetical protein